MVRLSVRSLAEYVFRSGSIESGLHTAAALADGTRIHQEIQASYGEGAQKEVPLQLEIGYEDITYVLEGRCDGLLLAEENPLIDEIKSTSGDLEDITEETYPVHWAQAVCYAYMYASLHNHETMQVQLTYVQTATGAVKQFRRIMTRGELLNAVQQLLQGYAPYAKLQLQHNKQRTASIEKLLFPFLSYRPGQRQLAGAVYKTIQEKRTLFAKAPTGIGKTISTLFPAIKAVGTGQLQRIFYLTAKTITRTAAEEALALMKNNGLHMNAVTLTAKDKVCFQEQTLCQKEHCPFADGFYDRINEAMLDILTHETSMTRPVIEAYARKHCVCPFEYSLELAYQADAVICDYNYIFDPKVSLKRLWEEQKRQTALLIDEAHNLVDRAREMYSASLQKSSFLQLKRLLPKGELQESVKRVNDSLLAIRKQGGQERIETAYPEDLIGQLEQFTAAADEQLAKRQTEAAELIDVYFAVTDFLRIVKLYDARYVTYIECGKSEVHIKLFCLDPSHLLQRHSKNYRAKIYFSATLLPLSYYEEMLGGCEEDFILSVPSPFSHKQLQVDILPVSTRYKDRERTLPRIAAALSQFIGTGNYFIFFPSHQYLREIYEQFQQLQPHVRTIIQDTSMNEEEREAFLAAFQPNQGEPLVGFAVLGGLFSEGIDLKGDRLNGVAIVGVGLPQLCLERNIIRDYFQAAGKNGYDYAYRFPGMNKVLQAGGRLIRSETDTGRLLLVDDRFLQTDYQQLFPEEWRHFAILR